MAQRLLSQRQQLLTRYETQKTEIQTSVLLPNLEKLEKLASIEDRIKRLRNEIEPASQAAREMLEQHRNPFGLGHLKFNPVVINQGTDANMREVAVKRPIGKSRYVPAQSSPRKVMGWSTQKHSLDTRQPKFSRKLVGFSDDMDGKAIAAFNAASLRFSQMVKRERQTAHQRVIGERIAESKANEVTKQGERQSLAVLDALKRKYERERKEAPRSYLPERHAVNALISYEEHCAQQAFCYPVSGEITARSSKPVMCEKMKAGKWICTNTNTKNYSGFRYCDEHKPY